ncbi:MAG: right-handed parallel beta-helix repeat-containing protein, partial [Myxococcota bacterium]|nr:right-handed parallel beta-helix repeat-containing protein [Myxococcota bacterium]
TLTATDCLVQESREVGVYASASLATLEGVQIVDTRPTSAGQFGRGVAMEDHSTLVVTDCLVSGSHDSGLVASESDVTLESVQVVDTRRNVVGTAAFGLIAQMGASAVATDLTVDNTDGPSLYATAEAFLGCTDCTLTDNTFAGAAVQGGGALVLESTLIENTSPESNTGGGVGVFVDDRKSETYGPPSLTLLNSTVRDNAMGAIYIKGMGSIQLTGNELSGGEGYTVNPGIWSHGDAVFVTAGEEVTTAWDETELVGLLLQGNSLTESSGAGVFLDGAGATLSGNTYEDNTTDVVRQVCDDIDAPQGLDDEPTSSTLLCPDYDYRTRDLDLEAYLLETEVEL